MVRKAAVLGYRHMIRDTEVEDELASDIGRQPRPEGFDDEGAYHDALREYVDALKDTGEYREWYDRVIDPTLYFAQHVGNWYTGSVHVARAAALYRAHQEGEEVAGQRLLVGSYGSGAQAEIHAETVRSDWEEEIAQLDVEDQLVRRYDLDFEEYAQIHDTHNHDTDTDVEPFTAPEGEFAFDGWGRMGERKYRFVE